MIGIGIVTCNRNAFFKNLLNSISSNYYIEAVNDGDFIHTEFSKLNKFTQNKTNLGVGKSKNILFRNLLEKGCEHIFIIEDDMLIKNNNVFNEYIKASKVSGIKHFMFGYHGPANKNNNKPKSRFIVPYKENISIAFNYHCVGSFCYYHKSILEKIGIFDEKYNNAWEHVDHSYMIAKAGYIPAYWYWPDLANSYDYINEQACSEVNSTIRPRKDWESNIITGMKYFKSKHNYNPGKVPKTAVKEVYNKIINIKEKYSVL